MIKINTHSIFIVLFLYASLITVTTTYAQGGSEGKIWESWEKVSELPFSVRDGVGVVHFKNEIWMMGGWKYGPLSNGVYKSSDAINWVKAGNGDWPGRHGAGMVAFKDKLWVLSGDGYPGVWSSEDGVAWAQEVVRAPWGERYAPYVLVYDDKIWLMGGISYWDEVGNYNQDFERPFNDVWSSTDGVNWVQECESAPWGPRGMIHGSVVFNDEMWILGGGSKYWGRPTNIFNDVWKSKDGVNWELVTDNAGWNPRIHFSTIAFDNRIWAIDGTTTTDNLTNETWYSEDGKDWFVLNSITKFPVTHASTVFVHDNSLFMAAGFGIDAIYRYTPPKNQFLNVDKLSDVEYGTGTFDLNVTINSGLQPVYHVLDTSVAEVLPNNKLLVKNAGKTQVAISHPGSYGFFPLDTTYFDFNVKKITQNIYARDLQPELMISDTVRLSPSSSSGLPVRVVPNENIIMTSDTVFVIKRSGQFSVELIQEGNNNYYTATKKINFIVAPPKVYTLYPNPAKNFIKIITEESTRIDRITISTSSGKKINSISGEPMYRSFFTFDIISLPPGSYILTIYSQDKVSSHKFLKAS